MIAFHQQVSLVWAIVRPKIFCYEGPYKDYRDFPTLRYYFCSPGEHLLISIALQLKATPHRCHNSDNIFAIVTNTYFRLKEVPDGVFLMFNNSI